MKNLSTTTNKKVFNPTNSFGDISKWLFSDKLVNKLGNFCGLNKDVSIVYQKRAQNSCFDLVDYDSILATMRLVAPFTDNEILIDK